MSKRLSKIELESMHDQSRQENRSGAFMRRYNRANRAQNIPEQVVQQHVSQAHVNMSLQETLHMSSVRPTTEKVPVSKPTHITDEFDLYKSLPEILITQIFYSQQTHNKLPDRIRTSALALQHLAEAGVYVKGQIRYYQVFIPLFVDPAVRGIKFLIDYRHAS